MLEYGADSIDIWDDLKDFKSSSNDFFYSLTK
jgi:hypothetical protein